MNHELAKTLTTAIVQFIDRERPEGSLCCSSYECEKIEKAFEGGTYDVVEKLIKKKLWDMTEFEMKLAEILSDWGEQTSVANYVRKYSPELLALAKKELLSYPDESNPAIEAMADLERTFECNPDKLPGWLKDELNKAFKKGQESSHEDYVKGYANGYKVAEKRYNESVAYHYPDPVPPGLAYKSPQCYTDVVITPNTNSGTSTLKAEE